MKKAMILVAAVMMAAAATQAMAGGHGHVYHSGGHVYRSAPPIYGTYGGYCAPPVYHSGFSFGWSRPAYYCAPPIYGPAPVYAPAPIVVQAQPVYTPAPQPIVQRLQIPQGFVETGRRVHGHGSDAGTVDWMKGTLDGAKVKITFNPDGSRHEIEKD